MRRPVFIVASARWLCRPRAQLFVRALLTGFILVAVGPTRLVADAVTDWNALFLSAVQNETTAPPQAARNLAILHTAIFDAVNSIAQTHGSFYFKPRNRVEASLEAAAASAARQVSISLYPSRSAVFDAFYSQSVNAIPDGPLKTNGLSLGVSAANAILNWRHADGSSTTVPYIPGNKPGAWRRTPPFFRPPESPQWRRVVPFVVTNLAQFRPAGPPSLTSVRYATDFNQVKRLGARNSTVRTPEQTEIAFFWSDFSYTVTPPGHWNEIARNVATNRQAPLVENARTFALLNLAMADAAVVVWDAKYEYNFWRPVTAIHQGEVDGNPDTAGDPDWQSLLTTPAFPEYVSGHSAFSGAAAAVLSRIFGTQVVFRATSDALPGVVRTYDSFFDAANEIGMSRIYGGIHFLSADLDGLECGRALGEYVMDVYLLRTSGPSPSGKARLGSALLALAMFAAALLVFLRVHRHK